MLSSLQMLRGVAAYFVVVFHTYGFMSLQPEFSLPDFGGGMPGVELFFIMSGFIMIHTVRPGETPLQFFAKRLFRIAPIYWVATVAVIVAALNIDWIFADANLAPESILASFAFIPMQNNFGDYMPILYVGWTLNYEMLFYFVFAMGLFLPRKFLLPFVILAMTAIWLSAYAFGEGVISAFYGRMIILNFCTGCLLAIIFSRPGFVQKISGFGPVFIASLGAFQFFLFLVFPLPPALVGIATLIILNSVVFGLLSLDLQGRLKEIRFMNELGKSSYSAYLLHPFIVPIVGVAVMRFVGTSTVAILVMFVATFIATVIVATLSYHIIERPSNMILRKVFLSPRKDVTPKPL